MKSEKSTWRKWAPIVAVVVMALWIVSSLKDKKVKSDFNVNAFAQLPVLLEGRIQPLDSVAANSLSMLRGKSKVLISDRPQEELSFIELATKTKKMTAIEWFLEAVSRPQDADTRAIFRIDNGEVLGLLKLPTERKYFSFNELKDNWEQIQKQASRLQDVKEELRTPFEKGIVKLNFAMGLYFRIKNTFRPENVPNFGEEIKAFQESIAPGLAALKSRQAGGGHSEEDLQVMITFFRRYEMLNRAAYPMVVPPADPNNKDGWQTIGASLMEAMRGAPIAPAVLAYTRMVDSYGQNHPAEFNSALVEYRNSLAREFSPQLRKGEQETFFNHYAPFVKSITIYLLAFLLGCAFWTTLADWTRKTAFYLLGLAMVVHTTGLIFRMYLEGRPPVTNLYSSAIFVGWGAVVLGFILERIWKDGIGVVTASAVGVVTLIIAHNLALGGDTMQMLRAVLDTNFWLATHVVVITLGYSSMFLAGALAIIYVVRGALTRSLDANTGKALSRMVYGIICFATLFSFVGTILGGIWADQSWGRFWGWDPKENGALMIVIWCAVILHARWGGMIRERGLMALALVGNIITGFSWFGVNMLGVGLHSYGFMESAWNWLLGFYVSQLILIGITLMPVKYWRSSQVGLAKPKNDPPGLAGAKPAAA